MKKRHSAEQIVGLLRQADVDLGKGMNVPDVCRRLGISQQTYYRWRTKFGGMDPTSPPNFWLGSHKGKTAESNGRRLRIGFSTFPTNW